MKKSILMLIGIVGGFAVKLLGGWDAAISTLLLFMGADIITGGMVAAVFKRSPKTENGGLESKAGWKGLCRKGAVLILVMVGYKLDVMLSTNYIRDAVCIAFIGNETLSIIENAGLMGVPIPAIIKNSIEILMKKAKNTSMMNNSSLNTEKPLEIENTTSEGHSEKPTDEIESEENSHETDIAG